MFDVYFQYFGGEECLCENVNKIIIPESHGMVEIPENEILNHRFRLKNELHLCSETSAYTVSCNNLKCIKIVKK